MFNTYIYMYITSARNPSVSLSSPVSKFFTSQPRQKRHPVGPIKLPKLSKI